MKRFNNFYGIVYPDNYFYILYGSGENLFCFIDNRITKIEFSGFMDIKIKGISHVNKAPEEYYENFYKSQEYYLESYRFQETFEDL